MAVYITLTSIAADPTIANRHIALRHDSRPEATKEVRTYLAKVGAPGDWGVILTERGEMRRRYMVGKDGIVRRTM